MLFFFVLGIAAIAIAIVIIRAILSIGTRVDLLKEIARNTRLIAGAMEGGKSSGARKPEPPPESKPAESMGACRKCGKSLAGKQMHKVQEGGYVCDSCRREILVQRPQKKIKFCLTASDGGV